MNLSLHKVSRLPRPPCWLVALLGAYLTVIGVSVWLTRHLGRSVTICPLRRLVGVPCAACGTTRGWLTLLRGDVLGAFGHNPLFLLVVCLLSVGLAVRVATGRTLRIRLTRAEIIIACCAGATLLAANWAYVIIRARP